MTLWLAIAGWMLGAALAVRVARLMRRLELVARADHELRGPVTALTLAVEGLERRPELRRRAQALTTHLDRLRLGLADLAAAQDGRRAAPRLSDVGLEGVSRAAAEAWRPAARAAGRDLSFRWEAGPVVSRADRARLSQALGNALANAVEHGAGPIEVAGERRGSGVRIAVRDGGDLRRPGLSGAPPPARAAAGGRPARRGRGLSIAAQAAEDAGGSLDAPFPFPRRRGRRATASGRAEVGLELASLDSSAP